jgi:cytochrome c-type biogenesis protein CcmH/NrfG
MPTSNLSLQSPPAGNASLHLETARNLLKSNRPVEAAHSLRAALAIQPDCVEALALLGQLFFQFNELPASLGCLQQAAKLSPKMPRLNSLMGAVLRKMGRLEEAALCCEREIRVSPGDPDAHYNLALVLQTLQHTPAAIGAYQTALRLRPHYLDALLGLGAALRQARQTDAALNCFAEAVRLNPAHPLAHWELGTTQLALGQFAPGWKEFEWRWKLADFTTPAPRFEQPLWDGRDLGGQRILLQCEQGYGDLIQFSRYATLVANRHGTVILACPDALRSLMETVPGVTATVTTRRDLPPFDTHAPVMSLPSIFGTTLETIPATVPYLYPASRSPQESQWVADRPGMKVGVAWAGASTHRNDAHRSLPWECLKPLLTLPNLHWHSLQVGQAAEPLAHSEFAGKIVDLGKRFHNFEDTAAAIAELDLVLAVDTAAAHLAGAMGKTVWLLLPFEAEWRWMVARDDSPWYPTMRLFRQSSPGNWKELLERVARELQTQFRGQ